MWLFLAFFPSKPMPPNHFSYHVSSWFMSTYSRIHCSERHRTRLAIPFRAPGNPIPSRNWFKAGRFSWFKSSSRHEMRYECLSFHRWSIQISQQFCKVTDFQLKRWAYEGMSSSPVSRHWCEISNLRFVSRVPIKLEQIFTILWQKNFRVIQLEYIFLLPIHSSSQQIRRAKNHADIIFRGKIGLLSSFFPYTTGIIRSYVRLFSQQDALSRIIRNRLQ